MTVGATVFWVCANPGAIYSATNGTTTTLLVDRIAARGFAENDGYVYARTTDGRIVRVNEQTRESATIAHGQLESSDLAIFAGEVYFAVGPSLKKVSKDGSPATVVAEGTGPVWGIAATTKGVAWGEGQRVRRTEGTGDIATIDAQSPSPRYLQSGTDALYWLAYDRHQILRWSGSDVKVIEDPGHDVDRFAVRDHSTYWVSTDTGSLFTRAIGSTATPTLLSRHDRAHILTVGEHYLFWNDAGTIMKTPI